MAGVDTTLIETCFGMSCWCHNSQKQNKKRIWVGPGICRRTHNIR